MEEIIFNEIGDVSLSDYIYGLNETDKIIQKGINHYLNEAINQTVISACYDIFNKLIEDFKSLRRNSKKAHCL